MTTWATTDTQWTSRATGGWEGDASTSSPALSASFSAAEVVVVSDCIAVVDVSFGIDFSTKASSVSVDIETTVGECAALSVTLVSDVTFSITCAVDVEPVGISLVFGDHYGGVMTIARQDCLMHVQTTTKNPIVFSDVTENAAAFTLQTWTAPSTWAGDVLIFAADCLTMSAYAWASTPVVDTHLYDVGGFHFALELQDATTKLSANYSPVSSGTLSLRCRGHIPVVSSEILVDAGLSSCALVNEPDIESSCGCICDGALGISLTLNDSGTDHDAEFSCDTPTNLVGSVCDIEIAAFSQVDADVVQMTYEVAQHDCYWLCSIPADPFSLSVSVHDATFSNDYQHNADAIALLAAVSDAEIVRSSVAVPDCVSAVAAVCDVSLGIGDIVRPDAVDALFGVQTVSVSGNVDIYAEALALHVTVLAATSATTFSLVNAECLSACASVSECIVWNDDVFSGPCFSCACTLLGHVPWFDAGYEPESLQMSSCIFDVSADCGCSVIADACSITGSVGDVETTEGYGWVVSVDTCAMTWQINDVEVSLGSHADQSAALEINLCSLIATTGYTCTVEQSGACPVAFGNLAVNCWADNEYTLPCQNALAMEMLEPDYIGGLIWEKVRLMSVITPEKNLTSVIL